MMIECDELLPLSCDHWLHIIDAEEMNFKKCARLIGSARGDFLLPKIKTDILNRLERTNNKMLAWCFRVACFSRYGQWRPLWRENVAALGEVTEFDTHTMALVLSFLEDDDDSD